MLDRRQLLAAGAATAGVALVSNRGAASSGKAACARFAHVTDVHITPENDAPRGTAQMFEHLLARKDKPDFVINSGDAVMAINGNVTGAKAAELIGLWKAATRHVPVPIHSCLGNHDVWDGVEPTPAVPAEKKGFKLMVEALGMPAPYYSFDRGGWHFVMLNSLAAWPDYGVLTPEHFAWLKADLKATPRETPVCVVSHLPILSVTSQTYGDSMRSAKGVLSPKAWQHADCWAITELFRQSGNVRLCLSGHMHTRDRCEYRGTWYVCGGAASGAWWRGSEYGFDPCYGAVTLYPHGEFDYEFVDYGWKAREWRGERLPA